MLLILKNEETMNTKLKSISKLCKLQLQLKTDLDHAQAIRVAGEFDFSYRVPS